MTDMIYLPNHVYVELYAEMAEAILVEHQGSLIELYEKYQNKSSRYSKELAVGEILDALKEIKEGEEN